MDISKVTCPDCGKPMELSRAACPDCGVTLEGQFEVSPLGRLTEEDQIFVLAFLREHGSIRKMEGLFGISYPTVKNRLGAIVSELDRAFAGPSSDGLILEQLSRGEISVEEALERMDAE